MKNFRSYPVSLRVVLLLIVGSSFPVRGQFLSNLSNFSGELQVSTRLDAAFDSEASLTYEIYLGQDASGGFLAGGRAIGPGGGGLFGVGPLDVEASNATVYLRMFNGDSFDTAVKYAEGVLNVTGVQPPGLPGGWAPGQEIVIVPEPTSRSLALICAFVWVLPYLLRARERRRILRADLATS